MIYLMNGSRERGVNGYSNKRSSSKIIYYIYINLLSTHNCVYLTFWRVSDRSQVVGLTKIGLDFEQAQTQSRQIVETSYKSFLLIIIDNQKVIKKTKITYR